MVYIAISRNSRYKFWFTEDTLVPIDALPAPQIILTSSNNYDDDIDEESREKKTEINFLLIQIVKRTNRQTFFSGIHQTAN